MRAVDSGSGGMFFVHGFGGTGKTFLWSILGSKGDILLNVASSGIDALLLQGGRTAHSRFGIPIAVNEFTMCSMTAGSHLAALVKQAKLIIWDEAPMMSKHCFETFDRSLRDVMKCNKEFGGKAIVFGGDFRQILHVITDGGRVETVLAALNSSKLWRHCTVLKLTQNMRLLGREDCAGSQKLRDFSGWILNVGDGKINGGEVEIDIPDDLLITDIEDLIEALITEVYGKSYALEKGTKVL